MEREQKLKKLGKEAAELLQEFRREACTLGENPIKSISFIEEENTIIIEDITGEKLHYSLSEISYIFTDEVDGFNTCGENFEDGIELAKTEANFEFGRMSKVEFSNYIGSIIFAQYRCEEIYKRLVQIEKETEAI